MRSPTPSAPPGTGRTELLKIRAYLTRAKVQLVRAYTRGEISFLEAERIAREMRLRYPSWLHA